jgi:SAM-dependent methyltransferase
MESKEWFESWFDTSYYHILYKNRNEEEAKLFISKLVDLLKIKEGSNVLDLACGKGRHSKTLNEFGMNVLGVDLSKKSIESAKSYENETLKFEVHDMRLKLNSITFDYIFNLFTSFGYFDDFSDNCKVIDAIYDALKPNGIVVIDFMNSEKTILNLINEEIKTEDTIKFNIKRNFNGSHIIKNILFTDKNKEFNYTEKVQALKLEDFNNLLSSSKFKILNTFGDFHLSRFNPESSDRLIIIAQKI